MKRVHRHDCHITQYGPIILTNKIWESEDEFPLKFIEKNNRQTL